MVLDAETYDLSPTASQVLAKLPDDGRFKGEFPASQVEITACPSISVAGLAKQLADARQILARSNEDARFACAGVHPFASEEGVTNTGGRYDWTIERFGPLARRQLVCALQVHVAVPGANRVLPVYNALRAYLPELLAVAANASVYRGEKSGLATVRPLIAGLLPRQGIPPILLSWEHYAKTLDWGVKSGAVPSPALWWWELRPHHTHGTLEVRVPDAQTTVREAVALFGFVQSLIVWLADRHDADDLSRPAENWRIEENRWSALMHGTRGTLINLENGKLVGTQDRLHLLLDNLGETAARLGNQQQIEDLRVMIDEPPWLRQLDILKRGSVGDVVRHLSDMFTVSP